MWDTTHSSTPAGCTLRAAPQFIRKLGGTDSCIHPHRMFGPGCLDKAATWSVLAWWRDVAPGPRFKNIILLSFNNKFSNLGCASEGSLWRANLRLTLTLAELSLCLSESPSNRPVPNSSSALRGQQWERGCKRRETFSTVMAEERTGWWGGRERTPDNQMVKSVPGGALEFPPGRLGCWDVARAWTISYGHRWNDSSSVWWDFLWGTQSEAWARGSEKSKERKPEDRWRVDVFSCLPQHITPTAFSLKRRG